MLCQHKQPMIRDSVRIIFLEQIVPAIASQVLPEVVPLICLMA